MTHDETPQQPEDRPDEPGAERSGGERASARRTRDRGGSEGSKDTPPPLPDDDDQSSLGDTDQHSDANA